MGKASATVIEVSSDAPMFPIESVAPVMVAVVLVFAVNQAPDATVPNPARPTISAAAPSTAAPRFVVRADQVMSFSPPNNCDDPGGCDPPVVIHGAYSEFPDAGYSFAVACGARQNLSICRAISQRANAAL